MLRMGQTWPDVAPLAPPPEITEFYSDDVNRVREFLGNQFTEHVLKVQGRVQAVDTVLRAVSVGDVAVSYVEFAEPVEIEQTIPEEIFMVFRRPRRSHVGRFDVAIEQPKGTTEARVRIAFPQDALHHPSFAA